MHDGIQQLLPSFHSLLIPGREKRVLKAMKWPVLVNTHSKPDTANFSYYLMGKRMVGFMCPN